MITSPQNNKHKNHENKLKYHAHFDCFSGCAGDMMLASCLHAYASTSTSLRPQDLLSRIESDLKNGIPEIKNEFSLKVSKVWRGGMGSIAALKVDVESVYDHKPAPVPKDSTADASHGNHQVEVGVRNHDHNHSHEHSHHSSHEHSHSHDRHHDTDTEEQQLPRKNEASSHHNHNHSHSHGKEEQENETKIEEPHSHAHSHGHSHGHSHSNSGDGPLRNLPQIKQMLLQSSKEFIPQKVANLAIQTFTELAIAEAFTHGASSSDTVHFHEVGAIDSIVDVIGTLLALYHLSVETVSCSRLPMGEGTVWTDHGQLPVPAFATMRLLIGMKTCKGPGEKSGIVTGELVTPTAAALLRVLTGVADANKDGDLESSRKARIGRAPDFTPTSVGIGAGTKDFEKFPNVLRLIIGTDVVDEGGGRIQKKSSDGIPLTSTSAVMEPLAVDSPSVHVGITQAIGEAQETTRGSTEATLAAAADAPLESESSNQNQWNIDKLNLLQANLDDITAEVLSYAIELLLKNGAIDAWLEPIVMKKGRSAHTLNCLFRSEDNIEGKLMEIMFRHTTTLGIRIQRDTERASLRRKMIQVQTMYGVGNEEALDGIVNVKLGLLGEEVISMKAEFEDCKAISEVTGVPIKTIADCATNKAQVHVEGSGCRE